MFDPSKFTTKEPKPLPVVLLLDTSISMTGSKIQSLNQAVREMLESFQDVETLELKINLAMITFGPVKLHLPYTSATEVEWQDLEVIGSTPLGGALKMAKAMIECKQTTISRAYRPAVILVSDGMPTDDWQEAMNDFIHQGRSAKCDRMAIAIGREAPKDVLSQFVEGTSNELFEANKASELAKFFKRVTMSVTTRLRSANPNMLPKLISPVVQPEPTQPASSINQGPSNLNENPPPSTAVADISATVDIEDEDEDEDEDDSYWG